jgi:SAM-dependent methyltransferase
MATKTLEEQTAVREKVREGYGKIARTDSAQRTEDRCCGADEPAPAKTSGCCDSGAAEQTAHAVGYSEAELATLPEGANMGLSCGNPTALAELKSGEVVVDLGSGGGFDVFIAGQKVGAEGRAIGVDMTPDMLDKARRNTEAYRDRMNLDNVEFRLGEIEHLPLPDNSADVVISNCVINLSPDKPQVWKEIARVLRPGGRVSVSDLALRKPLPSAIAEMVEALVGCVAGAVQIGETREMALEAGLVDVEIEEKPGYVEAMTEWNDPLFKKIIESLPDGAGPGDFIASTNIIAKKPAA